MIPLAAVFLASCLWAQFLISRIQPTADLFWRHDWHRCKLFMFLWLLCSRNSWVCIRSLVRAVSNFADIPLISLPWSLPCVCIGQARAWHTDEGQGQISKVYSLFPQHGLQGSNPSSFPAEPLHYPDAISLVYSCDFYSVWSSRCLG